MKIIERTFGYWYNNQKAEVISMYRADRCDGQTIILSNFTWCREQLENMRTNFKFYCPECSEEVILKLGERQSWHFAHHPSSRCLSVKSNESVDHFQAKHMIYNWLRSYQFKPLLECYLPELKRRPDVCVKINQKHLVIELQRSHINSEQFYKRHFTYLEAGYYPIWIGLQPTIPPIPLTLTTFTQLDSFLISMEPVPHSIYFNLTYKKWLVCSDFYYLQPRKTLHWVTQLPFDTSPEELMINPLKYTMQISDRKKRNEVLFKQWKSQTLKKRIKVFFSFTPSERKMLFIFQKHQLNLNYFPAVCNFPQATQFFLDTPPQLWQSWIVMEVINNTPLHSHLHVTSLTERFNHIRQSFQFTLRPSTIHYKKLIRELLVEYLDFLCFFKVLQKIFPGVYEIIHHVTVRKSLQTLIDDDTYVIHEIEKYFDTKNK
ncbi:competence protein CoiA [Salipaludibacillus daqingensis]|uniref:competence protein CoiA n=1 Tax=Salipaludibacillus daqingensis TaxID=3041001 RepID=UPI0024766ACE|nr:competence protein CoiA family protein [Salipaludibacillus daqingensis]